MNHGIDVSSNNHGGGQAIDWQRAYADLKARGGGAQPFAIIKATQGNGYSNPWFSADTVAARAAGFAVGAYLMDMGNVDPASEEQFFRRVAGPLPQFDDLELPEGSGDYAAHCAALVAQSPAISYLNGSEESSGFPIGTGLWEANPNGQPGATNHPALIHQYDWTGTVAGVPGVVDLNAFLGSEEQFAAVFSNVAAARKPAAPAEEEEDMTPTILHDEHGQWLLLANGRVPVVTPGDGTAFTNAGAKYIPVSTAQLEAIPIIKP